MGDWHTTIRHFWWGFVVVACVTLYLFRPLHQPGIPVTQDQTATRTLQAAIDALRLAETSHNAVAAIDRPIATSQAELQWLKALGRTPTVTVYSAQYKPPSPAPVPTLQPNNYLPANFEAWHHADTLAASEQALKQTPVDLHIDQAPRQPSKVGAIYLSNGNTGMTYAVARRGQLDLDVGVAGGKGVEALAGYGYNIKNTDAGVFLGLSVMKPQGLPGIQTGIAAGLVVHP